MDERSISQIFREIDEKLPALESSTRSFDSRLIVGKGTCGLGTYHSRVSTIVKQSQLRDWALDAQRRMASNSRNLAAVEEAQRNALLLARMQKEDAILEEQAERRRHRAQQRRETAAQLQRDEEERRALRAEAVALESRNRAILEQERAKEMKRQAEQRQIDHYNADMLNEIVWYEELEREQRRTDLREMIRASRAHKAEIHQTLVEERRAAAKATRNSESAALRKRRATRNKEMKERRAQALTTRQEHEYHLQEALLRKEEAVEKAKEAAKAIPNADAIRARYREAIQRIRDDKDAMRKELRLIRSVTSML